jgi:hypothetical protein
VISLSHCRFNPVGLEAVGETQLAGSIASFVKRSEFIVTNKHLKIKSASCNDFIRSCGAVFVWFVI